jgi:hypothetical protein
MMYLSSFHNNRGYGYADINTMQEPKLFTWHTVKKISLSNNERNNFGRGITSVWPVNQKNLDEIATIVGVRTGTDHALIADEEETHATFRGISSI